MVRFTSLLVFVAACSAAWAQPAAEHATPYGPVLITKEPTTGAINVAIYSGWPSLEGVEVLDDTGQPLPHVLYASDDQRFLRLDVNHGTAAVVILNGYTMKVQQ